MASYCLVSDFDGTFTRREFYELALERYLPGDITHYWKDYAAGRITHFDALAGIFREIRCTEAELRALTGEMEPDPRTPAALLEFAGAGWDVVSSPTAASGTSSRCSRASVSPRPGWRRRCTPVRGVSWRGRDS